MEAASYTSAAIQDITAKVKAALRENPQVEVHYVVDRGLHTVLFIDRRG